MYVYSVIALLMAYSAYGYGMHANESKRITWVKLFMTLLAIAFVTLFMYKYYEVPVHFNKVTIDNLSNHVVTDSSRITISFNYDYNNSRSLRKNRTFDGDDCGIKYN